MNKCKDRYFVAGLKLLMTTYYDRTRKQALSYKSEDIWQENEADIIIDLGLDFYIKIQQEIMPYASLENIEYMYTGSVFNRYLINHNGCMLHSSAVVVDNYAYLFSADSGMGKSTHTKLWVKHFGDRACIINDDKPVLRFTNSNWFVYGTPWSGKNNLNANIKVRLGAIVFLERAENNWIKPINTKEAIPLFFNQTVRKLNREDKMDLVLKYMEQILTGNPIFKMGCNISEDAVIMAYERIRRV